MKRLLIVGFVLLVMSASASATDTRTWTMGNNGNILVDDANTFSFYGRTFNYPNIAVGEFSSPDDFDMFGINWKFGDDKPWVLGTYFTAGWVVVPVDYTSTSMVTFDNVLGPNMRMDLLYGRQLGSINLGFAFGYAASSYKSEVAGDQEEESFGVYGIGLGLTDDQGQWDVAIDMAIGALTDKASDGSVEAEKDSWNDIGVRGRYFYEYDPNMTFVFHGEAAFGTRSVKYPDPAISEDSSLKSTLSGFEFGIGMNCTPTSNVLTVLDLGIQHSTVKNTWGLYDGTAAEAKTTEAIIPFWKIGMEADVFSWMDIRMGATSNWNTMKVENLYKESWADNDTYLGFGFHWGRLHVDTWTDPELFLDGFNFVSGGSNNMNMGISALYEMF